MASGNVSVSVEASVLEEGVRSVFQLMCQLKRLDLTVDSLLFQTVHLPGRRLSECNDEVQSHVQDALTKFGQEARRLLVEIQSFNLSCQRFTDTLGLCCLAFSKHVDFGLKVHLLERVIDLYQSLLDERGEKDLLKAFTDDFELFSESDMCSEPNSKKRKL